MGYYFDDSLSINAYEGTDQKKIISSLAYRYVGQNLKHGLYYRAYTTDILLILTKYIPKARTRTAYGHLQSSIQAVSLRLAGTLTVSDL